MARTLALAHEIARSIEDGSFANLADAARTLGFTRARISQLLDLTMLAPEIQEEILFSHDAPGRDRITERTLRRIGGVRSWQEQRVVWASAAYAGLPAGLLDEHEV